MALYRCSMVGKGKIIKRTLGTVEIATGSGVQSQTFDCKDISNWNNLSSNNFAVEYAAGTIYSRNIHFSLSEMNINYNSSDGILTVTYTTSEENDGFGWGSHLNMKVSCFTVE